MPTPGPFSALHRSVTICISAMVVATCFAQPPAVFHLLTCEPDGKWFSGPDLRSGMVLSNGDLLLLKQEKKAAIGLFSAAPFAMRKERTIDSQGYTPISVVEHEGRPAILFTKAEGQGPALYRATINVEDLSTGDPQPAAENTATGLPMPRRHGGPFFMDQEIGPYYIKATDASRKQPTATIALFQGGRQHHGETAISTLNVDADKAVIDFRATVRPDGKLALVSVLGEPGNEMLRGMAGNWRALGLSCALYDPSTATWSTPVFTPTTDAKGKGINNLYGLDLQAMPDNSLRFLGHQLSVQTDRYSHDLLLVGFDPSAQRTFLTTVSHYEITGIEDFDPSSVVIDGTWYVLMNDKPENKQLRDQGDEVKVLKSNQAQPTLLKVANDGTYEEIYFGTPELDGWRMAPNRFLQIGPKQWICPARRELRFSAVLLTAQ